MSTINDISVSTYTVARESHKCGKFKVYRDEHGDHVQARVGEMNLLFGDVDSARTFAYGILTAINEAKLSA